MSNLVKWLLGIAAVAVIGGGGYAIVESQHNSEKETESSVSSHKKASSHKRDSKKSSSEMSSSSSEVSSSEESASSTEQAASSQVAAPSESAAADTQTSDSQVAGSSVVGNPQGAVQADPNTYVTTPGAATSAVAAHMSQVQGFDPNRFTLSAHPSDGGAGYTVSVSNNQIAGTLAVYQVSANGIVTQIQ
ncbi:hypothetical protein D3P96_00330 [Weissella viridescens]|uniref:Uncharacterized protein n=1 Tax=Weissella viridescens TaxID=1629 RepID=A0A3P2RIB6_WEIVI|nr:hypothetical protein [Weissella viridescens]RRG18470.1 hypothetical protein D3P96_00330 [Weissella viridescens]